MTCPSSHCSNSNAVQVFIQYLCTSLQCLVGWLWFNGSLRQYLRLEVSVRERERHVKKVEVSHSLIAVGAVGDRVPLYLGHS